MKLKLFSIVFCAILLIPTIQVYAKSPPAVPSVYLDGERLSFTTNPIIENGSTLVPMRVIFEKQGAKVKWDQVNQAVTATKGDISITYVIGDKQATVNGNVIPLNTTGKVIGGSTLVPLRFVSESLGNVVGWEKRSRTVIISSASMIPATVQRVVDGDTVEVKLSDGTLEKVRLIGIDTPESVHPNQDKNNSDGKLASEYTKEQLLNKDVLLEFDVGERDQYGRLLSYLYVNGLMYNAKLAAEGYATQMTYQPNVKWETVFKALVSDARQNDRGLWSYDGVDGVTVQGTTGKLSIDSIDYVGEIVTITNKDTKSVNLTGWTLLSVKGNQVYTFPEGYVIEAGKTIYVTSGKNAKEDETSLKWTTANVHNNDKNDPGELYDMSGILISEYR